MTTPSDHHARASELFLEVRELDGAGREAALAAIEEATLRAEVVSLLEHDTPDEPMLDRIGPYRVIERIGRGGSGQVFLAEQDEPIQRRVAIKVVPQAAVSPELAARFEVERSALERTEHPNIARVLDAGRTPDGLPYLVMDYVEGEPITNWCERRDVPLHERIRLVLAVADAIQHAHQRGVIHRDLKPANVLVTLQDGHAVPKVIDFGIAKPVAGDSPDLTAPGMALGTPSYMAPEQTGGRSVDTRADVYALGALLYELLTGQPPVQPGPDPVELMRRVRDEIPPPPSRVRRLPGPASEHADLDVIIGKALEKDPERRYPTVAALADDLQRMLRSEPVVARPPTWSYRTSRWLARNRALAAGLGLVVIGLGLGVSGLVTGLVEAEAQRAVAVLERAEADKQRTEADKQRAEADAQRAEAVAQGEAQREINRFLTEDLLAAASPYREGEKVTVLELLDAASDGVDERFADKPHVAVAIHQALGDSYAQLGAYDRAEKHLIREVELRYATVGPDAPETVHAEIAVSGLLGHRQQYDEALASMEVLMPKARRVLDADDPILHTFINDYGIVLLSLNRNDAAVGAFEQALEARRRVLGDNDPMVAQTLNFLAWALGQRGETQASIKLMKMALALLETSPDESRMVMLEVCNNLAVTYQDLNRDAEAEPYLRRAADIAAERLGPEHPGTLTLEGNLAGLESALGDPLAAAEIYRSVAERRSELFGPEREGTLTSWYGYYDSLRDAGHYDEAVEGFTDLVARTEASLTAEHWLSSMSRASLAHALIGVGRFDEALEQARIAEGRLLAQFGAGHQRTLSATAAIRAAEVRIGGD